MTEKINKGKSMLKRVIKILTNKPTKIDRPVFTKYFEKENKQIKDLEQLLKISNDASNSTRKKFKNHCIAKNIELIEDFSKEELEKAIEQYNSRDRRYGGVKEE